MKLAPFTQFGKTVSVPVEVWLNNKRLEEASEWDAELYIERGEDWYALMSNVLKCKRVLVVTSDIFKSYLNN